MKETTLSIKTGNDFVIGRYETGNGFATTAVAIKAGDLLVLDATTNVLTHSVDASDFNVVAVENVTAEQATIHATKNIEIPFITKGVCDVDEVTLNSVKLTTEQKAAAKGRATTATNINLKSIHKQQLGDI